MKLKYEGFFYGALILAVLVIFGEYILAPVVVILTILSFVGASKAWRKSKKRQDLIISLVSLMILPASITVTVYVLRLLSAGSSFGY